MGNAMSFPKDWKDFLKQYQFNDKERIYTNGSDLIPSFRAEQMMKYYLTQRDRAIDWLLEELELEHCGKGGYSRKRVREIFNIDI